MTDLHAPGEVWWVDLEPAVGSEANKTRPCVIVGSAAFYVLPMRLVIPCTTWQAHFSSHRNKVRVAATLENGLDFDSAVDGLQLRSVAIERFTHRSGVLSDRDMSTVMALVALILGLDTEPERS